MRALLLEEIHHVAGGAVSDGPLLPAYAAELGAVQWHCLLRELAQRETHPSIFSIAEVKP
jgi:hypothetical protein